MVSHKKYIVDMHRSNLHSFSFEKFGWKRKDFLVYRELDNKEENKENSHAYNTEGVVVDRDVSVKWNQNTFSHAI